MIDRVQTKTKCLGRMPQQYQQQRQNQQQVHLSAPIHAPVGRRRSRHGSDVKLPLVRMFLHLLIGHSIYATLCHSFAQVADALLQVPNRHTIAFLPGDLVIGSLIPIHERPEPKQAQTRTCGAVREQYGIQRVEAAFRTIDSINADPTILPNITLGIEIRDSCWHSPIALEQSIEFIRDAMVANEQSHMRQQQQQQQQQVATSGGSIPSGGSSITVNQEGGPSASGSGSMSRDNNSAVCAPLLLRQREQLTAAAAATSGQPKKVKNIVGVVGPASSGDTVQVQNLLQMFNMPQVGYSATSRDLSNKNFFKYFLRVVPSDKLQARVLIDLMLAHNWTYVTVVYTEGSYGSSLMNAFRERAQEVGICFATLESMPPNADDAKFDELIEAIQKHPNARIVICMCEGRTVMKLFSGFKRRNIINEYLVVGSDGWADRFDVVEKQEEYALGGISIRIHSAYVNDFDQYYFSLSPYTNQRNPWFAEFWESRFQCNLNTNIPSASQEQVTSANTSSSSSASPGSSRQSRPLARTPNGASKQLYSRNCTGRESLRHNHAQDAKMAFVQKAIILMALGLDSMQRVICPANKPGLCPEMLPVNGSTLIQHLMNVRFSFLGEEVYFDEQGDPPGKYEILNFQRRRPVAAPPRLDGAHSPTGAGAGEWFGESGNIPRIDSMDYSVSSANSSQLWLAADFQRKRQNAYQDSYSTLRVYRGGSTTAAQTGGGGAGSPRARRRNVDGQTRRPLQVQPHRHHDQAVATSGYSSTSRYEYVHVGSWKSSDGLSLFGEINSPGSHQWPGGGWTDGAHESAPSGLPKSVCSLPCAKGHAKKIQSDSVKCCWVCVPCRPNEYLFDEFKCTACEKGWWPNSQHTGCDQIPIKHLDWRSMEALTAISIAVFGLVLTLATAIVFIRHNDTPVVKSTTRELSYMILLAMILCYVNTFFLVAKPRKETCFVTRILPGFAFAMMYGALVTKTNRIARILAGSKKKIITRRPRFMSATSQVAITWIIVLIECTIIVFMLVREPADKMHHYPSDQRVLLVCNTTTLGIIAPLGFDFFLIAMCTLYAFKTRNVPENFNEAKFIGFTMYTTLVIWVAFVAIYLSSDHKVTTLSLCISFSALFALLLLFFPRCYIIIFKPEKNNRSFFTTTKNVRCHIGYPAGSANATAAAAAIAAAAAGGHALDSPDSYGTAAAAPGIGQLEHLQWDQLASSPPPTTAGAVSSAAGQQNNGASGASSKRISGLSWREQRKQQQQQRVGVAGYSAQDPAEFNQRASQNSALSGNSESLALVGSPTNQIEAGGRSVANHKGNAHQPPYTIASGLAGQATRPRTAGENSTGPQQPQQQPGDNKHGDGGGERHRASLLGYLFSRFLLAFARHSQRKESDKASSIQQHLRAIRHAENLDRQTHFRRSQVQLSFQRFDSAASSTLPGAFSTAAAKQLSNPQKNQLASPISGRDLELAGARLLAVLGQLVGWQNTHRLGQKLELLCQQSAAQALAGSHRQQQQPQQLPLSAGRIWLDLGKLAQRRLALDFLKFLELVTRESMDELATELGADEPKAQRQQQQRLRCLELDAGQLKLQAIGYKQEAAAAAATASVCNGRGDDDDGDAGLCKSSFVESSASSSSSASESLSSASSTESLSAELGDLPVGGAATTRAPTKTTTMSATSANTVTPPALQLPMAISNNLPAGNQVPPGAGAGKKVALTPRRPQEAETEFEIRADVSPLPAEDNERDPIERALECILGAKSGGKSRTRRAVVADGHSEQNPAGGRRGHHHDNNSSDNNNNNNTSNNHHHQQPRNNQRGHRHHHKSRHDHHSHHNHIHHRRRARHQNHSSNERSSQHDIRERGASSTGACSPLDYGDIDVGGSLIGLQPAAAGLCGDKSSRASVTTTHTAETLLNRDQHSHHHRRHHHHHHHQHHHRHHARRAPLQLAAGDPQQAAINCAGPEHTMTAATSGSIQQAEIASRVRQQADGPRGLADSGSLADRVLGPQQVTTRKTAETTVAAPARVAQLPRGPPVVTCKANKTAAANSGQPACTPSSNGAVMSSGSRDEPMTTHATTEGPINEPGEPPIGQVSHKQQQQEGSQHDHERAKHHATTSTIHRSRRCHCSSAPQTNSRQQQQQPMDLDATCCSCYCSKRLD